MSQEDKPLLPVGTVLNQKWVILEFIARGGMGEVYRAHQVNLKRDVAIKIVSKAWLETFIDDPEELENALRRFRQEVETMVQIRHPNVIQIYDYDKALVDLPEGPIEIEYIVLEYIPGRTLRSTMREEGFYPVEGDTKEWIKKYFFPVLEGVKAIHEKGIYHRDLKPENILLDGEIPKIADFGLARSIRLESITSSLEIKGTPTYMAPEQFVDFKGTDQRADIYALGKILYEAVEGRIPPEKIPFKQVGLKDPKTPFFKALDEIIRRATEEDPEKRFFTVDEFKEALEKALEIESTLQPSKKSQKTYLWVLITFLVFLLAFGGGYWWKTYRRGHKEVEIHLSKARTVNISKTVILADGVPMHFIPGGEIRVPPGLIGPQEETVSIEPFYLDEYPVTNHQYVNFLNHVLGEIQVENGVVKKGDEIWLYLGKVSENYEPIIYKDGKFVLNSMHASCPVVRVTAFGAKAYARFYQKRLPTKIEWFYVVTEGRGLQGDRLELPRIFYQHLTLPVNVMDLPPNALGIRGLCTHFGEWVLDTIFPSSEARVVLISAQKAHEPSGTKDIIPVTRLPWEAFEEVGFRCARSAITDK